MVNNNLREQYLYQNPDTIGKDFAKELGIEEVDVFLIKTADDLKNLPNFAR